MTKEKKSSVKKAIETKPADVKTTPENYWCDRLNSCSKRISQSANMGVNVTHAAKRKNKHSPSNNDEGLIKVAARILYAFQMVMNTYDFEIRESVDLNSVYTYAVSGDWEKYLKQFCAWPMALVLRNDVPSQGKLPLDYRNLFGTAIRRFIMGKIGSPGSLVKKSYAISVAQSILRLKKCGLKVSKQFIAGALRDHGVDIAQPDPTLDETRIVEQVNLNEREVHRQITIAIRRIVSWLLKGTELSVREFPLPSSSACYEEVRSLGGACEVMASKFFGGPVRLGFKADNISDSTDSYAKSINYRKPFIPSLDREDIGARCLIWDVRGQPKREEAEINFFAGVKANNDYATVAGESCEIESVGFAQDKDGNWNPIMGVPAPCHLGNRYLKHWEQHNHLVSHNLDLEISGATFPTVIEAEAIAIEEPCKIRVITKGPAEEYHFTKWVQQHLTRRMKTGNLATCFPALRGDIDEPLVEDVFDRFLRDLYKDDIESYYDCILGTNPLPEMHFLSGDYKGATDTLRRDLSVLTMNEIAYWLHMDPHLTKLLENCLVNHRIHYSIPGATRDEDETVEVLQQRGQLMGSFLSFPILNIINLAVNWVYLDPNLVKLPWNLPLVVNGDDVLSIAPQPFVGWAETVKVAGFEMSMGKNYVNKDIFCINSRFFGIEENCIRRLVVPAVENIFNECWGGEMDQREQRKKEVSTKGNKFYSVGPGVAGELCHSLLETARSKAWLGYVPVSEMHVDKLRVEFMGRWMKELKATGRSWFVPQIFGGLGLPGKMSEDEQRFCRYAASRWKSDDKLDWSLVTRTVRDNVPSTMVKTMNDKVAMDALQLYSVPDLELNLNRVPHFRTRKIYEDQISFTDDNNYTVWSQGAVVDRYNKRADQGRDIGCEDFRKSTRLMQRAYMRVKNSKSTFGSHSYSPEFKPKIVIVRREALAVAQPECTPVGIKPQTV